MIKILLSLIVLLCCYYIYRLISESYATVENFEDKYDINEEYKDPFDKEFVDFYNIIYNDPKINQFLMKMIKKQLQHKKEPSILVIGSNCGHLLTLIKEEYPNVKGLEKSENMLKKSRSQYPYIKTIKGNIEKEELFISNSFDLIIFEQFEIHKYNQKTANKIMKNIKSYLKENGLFITPILEEKTLHVKPRYYTTNYIDNVKNIHGFTYLNDFAHDCYFIKKKEESEGYNYDYFDKIVLKNKKFRIKKTQIYVPEKEKMYETIIGNGFEIKKIYDIYELDDTVVYEIGVFTKMIKKKDVNEIEKNKK